MKFIDDAKALEIAKEFRSLDNGLDWCNDCQMWRCPDDELWELQTLADYVINKLS